MFNGNWASVPSGRAAASPRTLSAVGWNDSGNSSLEEVFIIIMSSEYEYD